MISADVTKLNCQCLNSRSVASVTQLFTEEHRFVVSFYLSVLKFLKWFTAGALPCTEFHPHFVHSLVMMKRYFVESVN